MCLRTLTGICCLASLFSAAAQAQSLADVARKTGESRNESSRPASKPQAKAAPLPATPADTPPATSPEKAGPPATVETAAAAVAETTPAPEPKSEAWWRDRLTTVRARITDGVAKSLALNKELRVLTMRLGTESVNSEVPSALNADRQKLADEIRNCDTGVAADRAELQNIVAEGRRDGVPSTWLR